MLHLFVVVIVVISASGYHADNPEETRDDDESKGRQQTQRSKSNRAQAKTEVPYNVSSEDDECQGYAQACVHRRFHVRHFNISRCFHITLFLTPSYSSNAVIGYLPDHPGKSGNELLPVARDQTNEQENETNDGHHTGVHHWPGPPVVVPLVIHDSSRHHDNLSFRRQRPTAAGDPIAAGRSTSRG